MSTLITHARSTLRLVLVQLWCPLWRWQRQAKRMDKKREVFISDERLQACLPLPRTTRHLGGRRVQDASCSCPWVLEETSTAHTLNKLGLCSHTCPFSPVDDDAFSSGQERGFTRTPPRRNYSTVSTILKYIMCLKVWSLWKYQAPSGQFRLGSAMVKSKMLMVKWLVFGLLEEKTDP